MTELQSLASFPVGAQATAGPSAGIEEVTVKRKKDDDEGFTFWDFLDVINPLQHIPVVNTIYREMTGDEIKAPSKLIGSAIIGGPIGLGVAMADVIVEDSTGKDLGGHAMALFQQDEPNAPVTATAAAGSAAQTPAATKTAGATVSGREFIPAAFAAVSSASLTTKDIVEDDEEIQENETQQTEAAIAAAAAAAPQGLVFMPLAGRQPAGGLKTASKVNADQRFLPINPVDRAPASEFAARSTKSQPLNPAIAAQVQTTLAGTGGGGAKPLDPLLEATKPRGDTGLMPALDPFAAARTVQDESGAVAMPAWFDRAMIDAMDKYQAMQSAGQDRPAG